MLIYSNIKGDKMDNEDIEILTIARDFKRKRQFDDLIEFLKEKHNENPDDQIVSLELAKSLLRNKHRSEGVALLNELIEQKHNVEAVLILGRLDMNENRYDDAKKKFRSILNTQKQNQALYELGRVYFKKGNIEKAKYYFTYVYENDNQDKFVLFELGKIAKIEGNLELAKKYYQDILNIKPDKYALFELGKIEALLDNYDEAIKCFNLLLDRNSSDIYTLLELGKTELKNGNPSKARECFSKVLEIKNGNDAFALYELAKLEINDGHMSIAKEMLYKVLVLKPNDRPALVEIGNIEIKEKHYAIARDVFKKIIDIDPDDYCNLFELGKVEFVCGNSKKALEIYDELIDKTNYIYAYIEKARILSLEGFLKEAEEIYFKLLSECDLPGIKLELGRLALVSGNYSEAKKYFDYLISLDDESYSNFENIFLLIKQKKYNEADDAFYKLPTKLFGTPKYFELESYLNFALGKPVKKEFIGATYFEEQLYNYSKEFTVNHVLMHQVDGDVKKKYYNFSEDIDLYELIDLAEEKIKDMNPTQLFLSEKYIVTIDKPVAVMDGIETNTYAVNTLPNSKKIISMYPVLLSRISMEKMNKDYKVFELELKED